MKNLSKIFVYLAMTVLFVAVIINTNSLNKRVEKLNQDCNVILMDNLSLVKEIVKLKEDVKTIQDLHNKLGK
jgi:uncharacterized protein YoxC